MHLIFHDYMSFKEHIYVLDRFGDLTGKKTSVSSEYGSSKALAEFQRVIDRVQKDIPVEIELARDLFEVSSNILIHMLPKHGDNAILIRYVLEHQAILNDVYGEEKAEKLLRSISGKDPGRIYSTAGRSYLASGRYKKAAEMFRTVLSINPRSRKAKAALAQATRAMERSRRSPEDK